MKIQKPVRLFALTAALVAALAAPAARADMLAFTATGSSSGSLPGYTLGYTFTLAAPVRVTQLGFWDYLADGLMAAVPVTLWNSAGVAQASATVPAGTSAGEINQYLYTPLATPVTLAAGTYTLSGYTSTTDSVQFSLTTITPATGITYGASRSVNANAYPATDAFGRANAYFGPNFQFTAVPEPSTWASVAAGAGLLGLTLRRRRARQGC